MQKKNASNGYRGIYPIIKSSQDFIFSHNYFKDRKSRT